MEAVELTRQLEQYFDRLWPLNRSIAGSGFRESLAILSELIPMEQLTFASGAKVFDWVVPKEWEVEEAYIIDPNGRKFARFDENNLHLVSYSIPFRGKVSLGELKKHLYTLPESPKAIPYVTSVYEERWGFCISHEELEGLPEGEYEVIVDSKLFDGEITVGEAVLPGETEEEVLFGSYLCHPSMANNELSGPLVLAFLYDCIQKRKNRRYTYRFVINPETIGSIAYLSLRGDHLLRHLQAGYQLTCIGDKGDFTYKQSRRGTALPDRVAEAVLNNLGPHTINPFTPVGSDERQYCSPGFDLPVGVLMRTPPKEYAEYHTSLDDKALVSFEALDQSIQMCTRIVEALEHNVVPCRVEPRCEPQLGRFDLYSTLSATTQYRSFGERKAAMMWLLNLADGQNDLVDIALKSGQPMALLMELREQLESVDVLKTENG